MKSRTILKSEYDEMGVFLCEEYLKKHELHKKQKELQRKLTKLAIDDLPDIVAQAYKEYPNYFQLCCINVNTITYFVEANTRKYDENSQYYTKWIKDNSERYQKNTIDFANFVYDKLKKLGLEKYYKDSTWGYYVRNASQFNTIKFEGLQVKNEDDFRYDAPQKINYLCNYMKEHPGMEELVADYIAEYVKYLKFRKDISCAFGTITTTNMLKNELPEAYEYFYIKWGKKYERQDEEYDKTKKKLKKAQCDKIEGLRAAIS